MVTAKLLYDCFVKFSTLGNVVDFLGHILGKILFSTEAKGLTSKCRVICQ